MCAREPTSARGGGHAGVDLTDGVSVPARTLVCRRHVPTAVVLVGLVGAALLGALTGRSPALGYAAAIGALATVVWASEFARELVIHDRWLAVRGILVTRVVCAEQVRRVWLHVDDAGAESLVVTQGGLRCERMSLVDLTERAVVADAMLRFLDAVGCAGGAVERAVRERLLAAV
jgi:hypothetical protein